MSDSNAAVTAEGKPEASAAASAPVATKASAPLVAQKKKVTLREHLEGAAFKDAVAKALPRHLPPDRFLRVAITAMTRTPKLADCEPASFFNALLTLSQFGLEPDGRRAHLIPYENRKRGVLECQLILDWKGIAELVMRSGVVANLHADVIREGDLFEYSAGQLNAHVPHFLRRDAAKPADAGNLFAVYSLANFKDGTSKCEVLSMDEVEGIRRRSRAGQSGPWVTDFNEMAKKTAFRRLSKWLPLSSEIRAALEEADDDAFEEAAAENAKRVGPVGNMADALGELPPMGLPSEHSEGGSGE